jgi:predicted Zn-dependent protease with MMP-like domain
MVEVDPERFEVMVGAALDGLPQELGELMSNVAVTVQHDVGPAGLLGLYQGVPLTRRTTSYAGALPDRITIFRHAICAVCETEAEVVEQVRRTVIHEVGHHFGIGDARLHELGW